MILRRCHADIIDLMNALISFVCLLSAMAINYIRQAVVYKIRPDFRVLFLNGIGDMIEGKEDGRMTNNLRGQFNQALTYLLGNVWLKARKSNHKSNM